MTTIPRKSLKAFSLFAMAALITACDLFVEKDPRRIDSVQDAERAFLVLVHSVGGVDPVSNGSETVTEPHSLPGASGSASYTGTSSGVAWEDAGITKREGESNLHVTFAEYATSNSPQTVTGSCDYHHIYSYSYGNWWLYQYLEVTRWEEYVHATSLRVRWEVDLWGGGTATFEDTVEVTATCNAGAWVGTLKKAFGTPYPIEMSLNVPYHF